MDALKWRYTGTAVQVGLRSIIGIALAHLLSPEEFGVVAMALIPIGFANLLGDLGLPGRGTLIPGRLFREIGVYDEKSLHNMPPTTISHYEVAARVIVYSYTPIVIYTAKPR